MLTMIGMKKVKGYFVLIVKQFDCTMPGADFHYTSWCVAVNKFCRYTKTDKIRKFSTYEEAQRYAKEQDMLTSHDRALEVAYLTTPSWKQESCNAHLTNWVQITSEQDALLFDEDQKNGNNSTLIEKNAEPWNSKAFSSIFKTFHTPD